MGGHEKDSRALDERLEFETEGKGGTGNGRGGEILKN